MEQYSFKTKNVTGQLADIRASLDALYYMVCGLHALDMIESQDVNCFNQIICSASDKADELLNSMKPITENNKKE